VPNLVKLLQSEDFQYCSFELWTLTLTFHNLTVKSWTDAASEHHSVWWSDLHCSRNHNECNKRTNQPANKRMKCIAQYVCLLPSFHWQSLHLPMMDGQAELEQMLVTYWDDLQVEMLTHSSNNHYQRRATTLMEANEKSQTVGQTVTNNNNKLVKMELISETTPSQQRCADCGHGYPRTRIR